MTTKNKVIASLIVICFFLVSFQKISLKPLQPSDDIPLKVLWKFNLGSNSTMPVPVFDKASIYIYNNEGKLFALDPKKGGKKWEFKASGKLYSPPYIYNDIIYLLGYDGNLYSLYASNAKIKWQAKTYSDLAATPYVLDGKEVIVIRYDKLQGFDLETGLDLWKKDCYVMNYKDIFNYPDHLLYTDNTRFIAEIPGKCKGIWDYAPGNMKADYYRITEDYIVLSTPKIIFTINIKDGKDVWKLNINPKEIAAKGPVIYTFDNELFVATNNLVRIYDLKTGTLKKTFKNKDDIKRILVTKEKMLLFNENDEIYLVNKLEYKKGEKYILNEKIKSELYLYNNQIYFIDSDDNLAAVAIPQ
jgi:outer membrane protein assembly factor BamB